MANGNRLRSWLAASVGGRNGARGVRVSTPAWAIERQNGPDSAQNPRDKRMIFYFHAQDRNRNQKFAIVANYPAMTKRVAQLSTYKWME